MFSEHRAPLSVVITSTRLRAKANENQFSERVTEIISTGAHFTDTTEENNSVTSEVTSVDPSSSLCSPTKSQYDGAVGLNPDEPGTTGSFVNKALPVSECLLGSKVNQYKDTCGKDLTHLSSVYPSVVSVPHTRVARTRSLKTFVQVLFFGTCLCSASGMPSCGQVLSQPIRSGATVQCSLNVTPTAVAQFSINGTCNFSLSGLSPCDGLLSSGSCGHYISAAVNTSACTMLTLTIIADPSVNNTQITFRDTCIELPFSWYLTIEGPMFMPSPSGNSDPTPSPPTANTTAVGRSSAASSGTTVTGSSSVASNGPSGPLLAVLVVLLFFY